MSDFNSKYTGNQVEELLDIVSQGGTGGGGEGEAQKTTEAEILAMGFTKNLGTITGITMNGANKGTSGVVDLGKVLTEHQDISGKVDKVTGKGLSTEDFTTALKSKLEGLSNYDDTALSNAVSTLRGDFDKLVSGDTTTAIKTFNEVIAFLDGISDSEDLDSIIAGIEQQIAGKMDNVTLAKVATSGSYNDLSDKPIVSHGSLMFVEVNGIADDYAYYALPTSTTNFADEDDVFVTRNTLKTINGESLFGSGDITISGGATLTEADIAAMGFTKNTGTYSKPSGGIPKSDLASEVQTSLGKADTALQSYTEQYKGTITGVSANGTSVATSGVANIPAASTSVYGVTKLSSSTSSTSTTLAATASAVKSAYDLANSYKGTVTGVKVNGSTKSPSSGTVDIGNVVTSVKLNGTTYSPSSGVVDLGSVSGGSSSGGSTKEVIDVEAVESPIGFEVSFVNAQPNKIYICKDAVAWASIDYIQPTSDTISDYTFIFKSGIVGMTLETFVNVKWANDIPPVLEANKVYEVSLRGINWGGYTTYQGIIASFALGSAMGGGDND